MNWSFVVIMDCCYNGDPKGSQIVKFLYNNSFIIFLNKIGRETCLSRQSEKKKHSIILSIVYKRWKMKTVVLLKVSMVSEPLLLIDWSYQPVRILCLQVKESCSSYVRIYIFSVAVSEEFFFFFCTQSYWIRTMS